MRERDGFSQFKSWAIGGEENLTGECELTFTNVLGENFFPDPVSDGPPRNLFIGPRGRLYRHFPVPLFHSIPVYFTKSSSEEPGAGLASYLSVRSVEFR